MLNINKVVCYVVGATIAVLYGLLVVHDIIPEFINYNVFDLLKTSGWAWIIFLSISLLLGLLFGFLFSNFSKILKTWYGKVLFFVCVLSCILSIYYNLDDLSPEMPRLFRSAAILGTILRWSLICCLSVLVLKVIALLRKCYSKTQL